MRRDGRFGLILGGGALLLGVLVFGVALGRAMAVGPVPAPSALQPAAAAAGSGGGADLASDASPRGDAALERPGSEGMRTAPVSTSASTPISPEVLRLAVDRAPFDEDRTPPARRYTLPGDEPPARAPVAELPPPPDFRLLGAVSTPEGGWAIIRVGDGTPRMVATGDVVDGYTVAAVNPEAAVMAGLGRTLQVPLAGPAATVAPPQQNRNTRNTRQGGNQQGGNQGGGGNANGANAGGAGAANPAAMIQQFLGGGGGNLPAAAAEIMSRLQQGGGIAGMRIENGQIVVQGAGGEQVTVNPGAGTVQMIRGRAGGQGAGGQGGGTQGGGE